MSEPRRTEPLRIKVVLGAAVLFTLLLQTTLVEDHFYSGDGYLKALAVDAWSTHRTFALHLPGEEWIQALWKQGYHPFRPPFVGDVNGEPHLTFSPWFSLATAPFVALLGWRGHYVLPLLSTWVTWFALLRLTSNLSVTARTLGLLVCVASPLTLYSAMFWEHTPAIALALVGLTLRTGPRARSLIGGLLVAAAVSLREELLAPAIGLVVATSLLDRKGSFGFGVLGGLSLWLASNLVIFGMPLGLHGQQVSHVSISSWATSLLNTRTLLRMLLGAFPALFLLPFVLTTRTRSERLPLAGLTTLLVFTGLLLPGAQALTFGGSATGGRQWSARLLLFTVPHHPTERAGWRRDPGQHSRGGLCRGWWVGPHTHPLGCEEPRPVVNPRLWTGNRRADRHAQWRPIASGRSTHPFRPRVVQARPRPAPVRLHAVALGNAR